MHTSHHIITHNSHIALHHDATHHRAMIHAGVALGRPLVDSLCWTVEPHMAKFLSAEAELRSRSRSGSGSELLSGPPVGPLENPSGQWRRPSSAFDASSGPVNGGSSPLESASGTPAPFPATSSPQKGHVDHPALIGSGSNLKRPFLRPSSSASLGVESEGETPPEGALRARGVEAMPGGGLNPPMKGLPL